MSNLYDKAHELARVIEQDETYLSVKNLTEKIMDSEEKMKLIENFRLKQYGLQQKQMQGQQIEEQEAKEADELYQKLIAFPDIKQLFEAEERLSLMFSDINRILTGPLEKIYKKEDK